MKGTIDSRVPDAEMQILNDPKESAEHATIVDLIRNDLSKIANNVHVPRYRYIDKIITNKEIFYKSVPKYEESLSSSSLKKSETFSTIFSLPAQLQVHLKRLP